MAMASNDLRILRLETDVKAIYEMLGTIHTTQMHHGERLDGIDARLSGLDERLDRMDERFDRMDERFDRMDGRLNGMDGKLDLVLASLQKSA